MYFFHYLKTIG